VCSRSHRYGTVPYIARAWPGISFICVIMTAFLLFGCSRKTLRESEDYSTLVDTSQQIGKVTLRYGANEDDNWMDFARDVTTHELHRDVGSEYIRVWVSDPDWRESTIPLRGNEYDFANLDAFINAVIDSDAIPYILFAHSPPELRKRYSHNTNAPPDDIEEFANYVHEVMVHLDRMCRNGIWKTCDINKWYFEIWNEPWEDIWWQDSVPLYVRLYNETYRRIKEVAPQAKVGGYSLSFTNSVSREKVERLLKQCELDFISIHHYGNTLKERSSESDRMDNVKDLFYESVLRLEQFILEMAEDKQITIVNSEYSSDYRASYMLHLDEQYTAAWYASALIWQIKSMGIDLEMYYSGTSNQQHGGFGMWSKRPDGSYTSWPVFHMKKQFVAFNAYGADVYYTNSESRDIDIIAVNNAGRIFVTLVNKDEWSHTVQISVKGHHHAQMVNTADKSEMYFIGGSASSIPIGSYEVKFFEIYAL